MNSDAIAKYLHTRKHSTHPARSSPTRAVRRLLGSLRREWHAFPVRALSRFTGTTHVILSVSRYQGTFEMDLRSHMFDSVVADRFERHLADLVSALIEPTDTVIDVGANVGLFTVLAAQRAPRGKVLAIEPTPGAAKLLARNITRNQLTNVILYECAASGDANGVTLHLSPGNEEYASVGGLNHPNAPRTNRLQIEVQSDTLDRMVERESLRPSLLKIDVEGAEGLVLSGAQTILERYHPVILSELDDRLLSGLGHRSRDVLEMLRVHGYRAHDAHTGQPLPHDGASLEGPFIGEILAFSDELLK